jgi:predicted nucleic acid-binding protein
LIYLESSALLRAILEEDAALASGLADAEFTFASALTFLEADRAFLRASLGARMPRAQLAQTARKLVAFREATRLLAIGGDVLERARSILPVEPVRSLDAIHLATALLLREELGPLTFASTDRRIRENAEALGFTLLPA